MTTWGESNRSATASDIGGAIGQDAAAFVEQVDPLGVHAFDQSQLPRAVPFLQPLLSKNGGVHRVERLIVDETSDAIPFAETRNQSLLVL